MGRVFVPVNHKRPSKDVLRVAAADNTQVLRAARHPKQALRQEGVPLVHYGVIGSADVLLKDHPNEIAWRRCISYRPLRWKVVVSLMPH